MSLGFIKEIVEAERRALFADSDSVKRCKQ